MNKILGHHLLDPAEVAEVKPVKAEVKPVVASQTPRTNGLSTEMIQDDSDDDAY